LDQATAANPLKHPINAAPLHPQRQFVNKVHVQLSQRQGLTDHEQAVLAT
jgi:hypothetical protein